MKKLFLLLIAICAISLGMSAQQVVRGQVTDPNGEPLIGATVQPVGGGNGAATDVNGEFSLNLPYNQEDLLHRFGRGCDQQETGVASCYRCYQGPRG